MKNLGLVALLLLLLAACVPVAEQEVIELGGLYRGCTFNTHTTVVDCGHEWEYEPSPGNGGPVSPTMPPITDPPEEPEEPGCDFTLHGDDCEGEDDDDDDDPADDDDCRPGWGWGDKNHCHDGPPGRHDSRD